MATLSTACRSSRSQQQRSVYIHAAAALFSYREAPLSTRTYIQREFIISSSIDDVVSTHAHTHTHSVKLQVAAGERGLTSMDILSDFMQELYNTTDVILPPAHPRDSHRRNLREVGLRGVGLRYTRTAYPHALFRLMAGQEIL